LLKKGLTALTDWFKESWLGKKLGLDDRIYRRKKTSKIEKIVQANIKV
jgi:hypothetical protein